MRRRTRAVVAVPLALVAVMLAPASGLFGGNEARAAGSRGHAARFVRAKPTSRVTGIARASRTARATHTPRAIRWACSSANLRPAPVNTSRVAAATLCLIERERAMSHLPVLRPNEYLQRIATGQAAAMVIGDYFGDNGPGGVTPWQRITGSPYAFGAHGLSTAQNIGWGSEGLATPAAMVSAWMHSPPHREIMLTAGFRDIGVGVAPATPPSVSHGAPGATYTVDFAARG